MRIAVSSCNKAKEPRERLERRQCWVAAIGVDSWLDFRLEFEGGVHRNKQDRGCSRPASRESGEGEWCVCGIFHCCCC